MSSSKHTYQAGMAAPVVIIVVMVLVGLAMSGYIFLFPRSTVDQTSKERAQATPTTLDHEAVIGEEVKLDTFSVVMEGIKEEHTIRNGYPFTPGATIGIVRAEPGMKFVLAKLDIKNTSDAALVVVSDRFILRDGNGREYTTHDHESSHLQDFNYYLDETQLAVKGDVLGFIAFEVPESVLSYRLFVRE